MPNRDQRARTAAETLAIAQGGSYVAPSGKAVNILDAIQLAIHKSVLIAPSKARSLRSRADRIMAGRSGPTAFDVSNETTLSAGRRLVDRFGPDRVAMLNFASAKSPGGGFLGGSQAQEESLARASALYPCLNGHMTYYDA